MSSHTTEHLKPPAYNPARAKHTWGPLSQLNYYRLIMAGGFLSAFFNSDWISFPGSQNPQAYLTTNLIMLLSSLLFIAMRIRQKPDFETQVIISNASDIFLITLLSHYSGGLSSPFSILLIINITATGTFLRDRDSFLFAAVASLAVLGEQTYSIMQGTSNTAGYALSGLLGLVFFGITYLASVLSRRMRESELQVSERETDIINLQTLNNDIIQNMRTGIIVVDQQGHIRMANSSAESLLGNIPLQHTPPLKDIFAALDVRFREWQDQPGLHHKPIRQTQGLPDIQPGFRKLERTADTLIFLEDATQLNQRFQQIKLASLGRLTASIAHEIRNPLSAINHAAQLLQESSLETADQKLTDIITTQVQRLDKVIQNVLQLSRQQGGPPQTIELNRWLKSFCSEFIEINKLQAAQLQLKLQQTDLAVLFDSSHLHQVMNNLCTNAITHNSRPAEQVKIQIKCGHDAQFDQPFIDVIDNGAGISRDNIQQIFDPFFTTSSKGTGLGLYISREMIESNRAKISYTITEQNESCFRIHFLSSIRQT